MNLSGIKNISPNKNMLKKILSLVLSLIVTVVSFVVITNSNKAAQDTIAVLRIKDRDGLAAYELITKDNVEKYNLIKKEYIEDMILAEDFESVENHLIKYYARGKSILHKDQVTEQRPVRNEWLYDMPTDYEVVTIPYNHLECGGDVLLPGDLVRIRVSYEVDEPVFDENYDYENPNLGIIQTTRNTIKTEILFDEIEVKDMLNTNSHSIYEIYKDVMNLSEEQRLEVMKSQEFMKSTQPRSLLLSGTEEQITNYAKYKSIDTKGFLITILSRANNDVILDQFLTLESEVKSWIE